ncbi:amidohydrolase family protein [Sphingomonas bacterium]|uniref:amidohydrolase family protein n=1 Tax=Sphingomonas bacterium TaxID=1895847 RepID=UPI0020C69A43|nr:hypothetical protein [Sphingomonas bacterium]
MADQHRRGQRVGVGKWIAAVVLASSFAAAAQPVQPHVTALVGATVVDVDSGRETPDAAVLIEDGRIVRIGPRATVAVPPGARIRSMTGKWLIPGLMNMHVHLGLKLPGAAGAALVGETDPQEVLRMAGNARRSLLSGVTTVRLVGEDHGNDFALRAEIDRGEVIGPRIKTAGGDHRPDRRAWLARGGRSLRARPGGSRADQAGRGLDQDRDLRRHRRQSRRHLGGAHDGRGAVDADRGHPP